LILGEVLSPTNTVNVLKEHFDLPTDKQGLEGRIVYVDIVNGKFINRVVVGVDLGEQRIDVRELALDGERSYRTLHPL
jgi:hypothetical protein